MSVDQRPAFWQRQPRLPLEIRQFLQVRLHEALCDPSRRTLLVWPTVLGAPRQRAAHPDGIPDAELESLATRMVTAVGPLDAPTAWQRDLASYPDTSVRTAAGWAPHPVWRPFEALVSLRSGVTLLALTGRPEGDRYLLASAVALFNLSLFHECHDALEMLWRNAEGELKAGLQGLILLTSGYYHQQHHHAAGMRSIWKDGIPPLRPFQGTIETPWGRVRYADSLAMASERLTWLRSPETAESWEPFWESPPPAWELK